MPKVNYLLISTENIGQSTPLAVSGYSGKLYGHAEYDPSVGAHAFRVPADGVRCPDGSTAKWAGDMDVDIAKNMHRRFQRWIVRVEVEADLESAEGKLAQEVDALKARIAELEARLPGEMAEAMASMSDAEHEQLAAAFGLPPPRQSAGEEPPAGFGTTDLSEMGFDGLAALFDKLNAEGANIPEPEGKRSKVKLRDALNAHYAKAA